MAQIIAMFGIETRFETFEPTCITGTISLGKETSYIVLSLLSDEEKEISVHLLSKKKL